MVTPGGVTGRLKIKLLERPARIDEGDLWLMPRMLAQLSKFAVAGNCGLRDTA
jgi:hypothetical protein